MNPHPEFRTRVRVALHDTNLQSALARSRSGFQDKRASALAAMPEFAEMRTRARLVKEHTLAHLSTYLQRYELQVQKHGGHVHWARDAAEARRIVLDLCARAGGKRIAKGKSMVSEELELNPALQAAGFTVTETDLGEYIIQLAGETPSHIIAPAVHKTRAQIVELFAGHHKQSDVAVHQNDGDDKNTQPPIATIVGEARRVLREVFTSADIGITGANFLVAENGASVLVTNEGNGDLVSCLPAVHIVTASIEKVVPTLEDAALLLRLLKRSATGQSFSNYTTLYNGLRRTEDCDGPREYHVVLLDNGRSQMLNSEFRDMLRCIRCGACLNHCPVYGSIGGHAYSGVYSGPMGAVLGPLLNGLRDTRDLPNACTLNGRCQEVCPVDIPLPDLLRKLRVAEFDQGLSGAPSRVVLAVWGYLAVRPRLYRVVMGMIIYALAVWRRILTGITLVHEKPDARRATRLGSAWHLARLAVPQGRRTFIARWHRGERS